MLNLKVGSAKLGDWQTARRYNYTADFMYRAGVQTGSSALSLGGWSEFDSELSADFGLRTLFANDDLDSGLMFEDETGFDYILCFEVIEHLMNPLIAMRSMRLVCHPETSVFMSWPCRPSAYWTDQHFHEYDDKRFATLVDCSGFKIVAHEKRTLRHHPLFYLTGWRPFMRLSVGRIRWNLVHLMPD